MTIETQEHFQPSTDGKKVDLKEPTIKELSQFDNKKPEELELEFDHFDLDNSYPSLPIKGSNIVHLDFVYKQLLDEHKACKTTLSLQRLIKRKTDRSYKHFIPQFAELQYL